MSSDGETQAGQGRRTFLARFITVLGSAAALLSRPRPSRAATGSEKPATGPILYRRGAETERYYRTLYQ